MFRFSALLLTSTLALSGASLAHEMWVQSGHTHGGEILKADIGYGHNFTLKDIAPERVHFFREGMNLVGPAGTQKLVQRGEHNYHFETARPVAEGSYLVTAEYQPTFWSHDAAEVWAQKSLRDMPGAVYCEQTRMFGKNVLNVGHESADRETVTRPLGQLLEIVPLENPARVRPGETLPVQVLYRGEPLVGATLTASFAGFDKNYREMGHAAEAQAFSKQTDNEGKVDIIPLRQGFWKAKVIHKAPYPDQAECQQLAAYATLTFELGSGQH
ncbi:DUF4198 domain-containing protein [Deinococcus lacus]|uniref:DUF4198 domain-containing protein n=1 Tax=Deinococcus lacus TaxID=392561 RepID=A0ABW1YGJ0_9DEIO